MSGASAIGREPPHTTPGSSQSAQKTEGQRPGSLIDPEPTVTRGSFRAVYPGLLLCYRVTGHFEFFPGRRRAGRPSRGIQGRRLRAPRDSSDCRARAGRAAGPLRNPLSLAREISVEVVVSIRQREPVLVQRFGVASGVLRVSVDCEIDKGSLESCLEFPISRATSARVRVTRIAVSSAEMGRPLSVSSRAESMKDL
jgi:hypothetical protein